MQTLFDSPPPQPAPTGRSLRPYQLDAIEKLDHVFFTQGKDNTILSLPPSGGKTFTATQYIDSRFLKKGAQILWLAHREELIDQAVEDASEYCPGARITTWYVGGKDMSGDIVVASVPSWRSLLAEIARTGKKFEMLVIDEAHHAAAETYQAIIKGVPHVRRLGLTGTPKRMDGKHFGFDNIAFQVKFMELVNAGWCAKPIYIRYKTKQTHLFQVRAGDFTAGSLKSLNNVPRNEMVAKEFFDHPEYWPAMVYTVNIEHGWALRAAMLEEGRNRGRSARICVVTGETPKTERREVVEAFRQGKVDAILNCGVFTEGTDLPTIKSIFMTRPTMSETLYLQMALRGGRSKPGFQATGNDPSPGLHKDNCYWIVDFVDSAHHYAAASRGFALRSLDPKQVKSEVGIEDMEKAKLIVKEVPDAFEEFAKKWRGIKYEDEDLEPEQWIMSNVGSILITSSPFERERQWVLTPDQDFAVLCGTEYVWRKYNGWSPSKAEAAELMRYSHQLFGKEQFDFNSWKTILYAWVGFKRYRQDRQQNGGRTWIHMSSVETPPLQEVFNAIDEIEKEAAEVDKLFVDEIDAWQKISDTLLQHAPPEHLEYWKGQIAKVHNCSWGDKQFSFHYDGSPAGEDGWFTEYLVRGIVRKMTDRDDVRVTMTFTDSTFRACGCGGVLVLRSSGRGHFYGCDNYPRCRASAQPMSKADVRDKLCMRWKFPAPAG